MRAVLEARGDEHRCVSLADSFQGLPAPILARFPADADLVPTAPVEQLAVLRMDGDYYQSTWKALEAALPEAVRRRVRHLLVWENSPKCSNRGCEDP